MAANPNKSPVGRVFPLSRTKPPNKLYPDKIAIPIQGKIELIDISNISYLKADSNYTEIHLLDQSTIVASTTLKKYEAHLNPKTFIRVHSGYIINRKLISTYIPNQHKLILHNTQEIPVSRSRKEEVMNFLKTMMV